jgi:hypothetical protein
MGFFGNLVHSIGSGISSVAHTVGSGLAKAATAIAKPIYNKVLKPAYNKVLKPAYNRYLKPVVGGITRVGGKFLSTGEHIVTGGLDFGEQFIGGAGKNALHLQNNLGGISDTFLNLLKNPMVMIAAGIGGLIVITKI